MTLPETFFEACKRATVPLSEFVLLTDITGQSMSLWRSTAASPARVHNCRPLTRFPCSTSRFGVGQSQGSNCTPLGLHRIVEKIGGGWPAGTVFKGRKPIGYTWKGMPDAKITTRIFWLEGLETGFNRGGTVDSHARYIYIHGTADQRSIGRPTTCGCIHLADADLTPLFDLLPQGTLVWIRP